MLALLTFDAETNNVAVNWYSTRYDALYGAKNQFTITVPHVPEEHECQYTATVKQPTCTQPGGADNNIRVVIQLRWDTGEGIGYQEFSFTDRVIGAVYSSNNGSWSGYDKMFSMVITGFAGIENLRANMMLVSGTNVLYVSSTAVPIT